MAGALLSTNISFYTSVSPSFLLPSSIHLSLLLLIPLDGYFPMNISKSHVEEDHPLLEQAEVDSLIRLELELERRKEWREGGRRTEGKGECS